MTTVLAPVDLHLKRLFRAAQEYRASGYRVVAGPAQSELPEFLRGHEPDLIAIGDHDNVVVEVKDLRSVVGTRALSQMAAAVEQQPTWRLELILLPEDDDAEGPLPVASDVSVVRRLTARALVADSDYALIAVCAALEHAVVVAAAQAGIQLSSSLPGAALKTLFAYGLIDDAKYRSIEDAMRLRNDVVHGRRSDIDAGPWVGAITPIIEELISAS